jgi:hypothetical protein
MGGRIEIVHDDMFNGPSDLVVLPCSTIPTVASFVAERLKRFSIPFPRQAMRLGEVRFEQLTAATQLAPVAAYAASVKAAEGSDANAIKEIGRALGRHARDNASIRIIATPLLGTGAGKLDSVTALEALSSGFRDEAPDGATLRIFVLDADVYASFERDLPPKPLRPGIDVDMRGVRRANARTQAPRRARQRSRQDASSVCSTARRELIERR